MSRPPSDDELIARARTGDAEAAEALFARHWPRTWRAAYAVLGERTSAEDAAQAAIERGFGALDSFTLGRPFGPWISRIAVNQALNLRRARRREVALDGEPPPRAGPDAFAEIAERDELFGALARLDPDRRLVVAMRFWLDLDPPEIAEILGVPRGTVSSRLSRALDDLRRHLEVTRP